MKYLMRLCVKDWHHSHETDALKLYYSAGITMLACFFVHVILLCNFIIINIPILVIYNIFSIIASFLLLMISRRGKSGIAATLICVEIMTYSAVLSALTGYGVHSQWYIFIAVYLHLFFFDDTTPKKAFIIIYAMIASTFSYLIQYFTNPIYPLSENFGYQNLSHILMGVAFLIEVLMASIVSASSKAHSLAHIKALENDSMVDELTVLWNRRYAKEFFSQECLAEETFTIAMVDIDLFKNLNDTYGHAAGDQVLRQFSAMLKTSFRESDVAIRWGGEEFLVILQNSTIEKSYYSLDKFRKQIEDSTFIFNEINLNITVTIGISQHIKNESISIEEVIEQSDLCLYYGKYNGRNITVTPYIMNA